MGCDHDQAESPLLDIFDQRVCHGADQDLGLHLGPAIAQLFGQVIQVLLG